MDYNDYSKPINANHLASTISEFWKELGHDPSVGIGPYGVIHSKLVGGLPPNVTRAQVIAIGKLANKRRLEWNAHQSALKRTAASNKAAAAV